MALYESVVIARQDLSTAQVDTLGDELAKILTDGGIKVAKRENWGLRSLNFRIKKTARVTTCCSISTARLLRLLSMNVACASTKTCCVI